MARPANTDAENEVMRKRLAKGALSLFRESGQQDISLRKLAIHMGMSHTLLYRYFKNKESLFDAVRCASLAVLYELLCEADSIEWPPLVRMRKMANVLITYGRAYPKEYRFVFSQETGALKKGAALLVLRHRVFDHIVDIAVELKRQRYITVEPRMWTHMVWATLHGLLTLNENNQLVEGCSFEELAESTLDFLLGVSGVVMPEQSSIA